MASHSQLELYSIDRLLVHKGYNYTINIIDNLNNDCLDEFICNLALFYKGAASFEWLEIQPISKLIMLQKQAEKINGKTEDEIDKQKNKS